MGSTEKPIPVTICKSRIDNLFETGCGLMGCGCLTLLILVFLLLFIGVVV